MSSVKESIAFLSKPLTDSFFRHVSTLCDLFTKNKLYIKMNAGKGSLGKGGGKGDGYGKGGGMGGMSIMSGKGDGYGKGGGMGGLSIMNGKGDGYGKGGGMIGWKGGKGTV
jgi:hypothetical protein